MPTTYQVLGRDRGIRAAVDEFYARVAGDPLLRPYFDGVDLGRLRWHQAALLTALTGGPRSYSGRDLGSAHTGLEITGDAFDRVVEHLTDTLRDVGVGPDTVEKIAVALTPYREKIVASLD